MPNSQFASISAAMRPPVASAPLVLAQEEGWPFYAEDELQAAVQVLKSGKVNQWTGDRVKAFQDAYAQVLSGGYAVAVANGSLALELILRSFGIGPGDEVIVTPRSFVASAFCVRLVGATPVFVDVDRDSGNITPDTIAAGITARTRAVIPVHLAGWPAQMVPIAELATRHGILLIEDCAQAHGAMIDGRAVGSFGDAAAFSFCQDKIISTAGEGGLAWFREREPFERGWSFKDHGKSRRKSEELHNGVEFRWLHDSVGTNWRLTEIAAAIGLVQLKKLPAWNALRTRNAGIWRAALDHMPDVRIPAPAPGTTHAYYKFYVYLCGSQEGERKRWRDRVLSAAVGEGLRVFSGSCSEVYREDAFSDLDVQELPVAHELGQTSLMMEVHPTLDPTRIAARGERLAQIIHEVAP